MKSRINKLIKDLEGVIEEERAYEGKKWKRSHSNQPGVYDVRLNFGQIMILNEALKHEERNSSLWSTPVFSRKIIHFGRLVFVSVSDLCNHQKSAKRKHSKK